MSSWTDDLTTRERVRKIALSLTRARSVNWIKTEAAVSSWDTTKDELERLVEYGQLKRVEDDTGGGDLRVTYAPDNRRRYLDRVNDLVTEHTRGDLRAELVAIQDQLEEWQEAYKVDSHAQLEQSLTESDVELSSDEIRERNRVLRRWERTLGTKQLISHALRLYDDLTAIDDPESRPQPETALQ